MHGNPVIRKAAGRARQAVAMGNVDNDVIQWACRRREVEQSMRWRAAQHGLAHALCGIGVGANVFKDIESAARHYALAGRTVVIPHVGECLPQQHKISIGKAGAFGQIRGDETFHSIESVRDELLAAHRAQCVLRRLVFQKPSVVRYPSHLFFHTMFFFVRLASDTRVIPKSIGNTGSIDRAKENCTGPRTWPALAPVLITAPNVRTS